MARSKFIRENVKRNAGRSHCWNFSCQYTHAIVVGTTFRIKIHKGLCARTTFSRSWQLDVEKTHAIGVRSTFARQNFCKSGQGRRAPAVRGIHLGGFRSASQTSAMQKKDCVPRPPTPKTRGFLLFFTM